MGLGCFHLAQYLVIPEPEKAKPSRGWLPRGDFIVSSLFSMLAPIHLHDPFVFQANEIEDVITNIYPIPTLALPLKGREQIKLALMPARGGSFLRHFNVFLLLARARARERGDSIADRLQATDRKSPRRRRRPKLPAATRAPARFSSRLRTVPGVSSIEQHSPRPGIGPP
jgi:hypothetical protein